jgi:hypothetical protein
MGGGGPLATWGDEHNKPKKHYVIIKMKYGDEIISKKFDITETSYRFYVKLLSVVEGIPRKIKVLFQSLINKTIHREEKKPIIKITKLKL